MKSNNSTTSLHPRPITKDPPDMPGLGDWYSLKRESDRWLLRTVRVTFCKGLRVLQGDRQGPHYVSNARWEGRRGAFEQLAPVYHRVEAAGHVRGNGEMARLRDISASWDWMIVSALVQAKGTASALEIKVGASVLPIAALWDWERVGAIAKARRGRMYLDFVFRWLICRGGT